MWNYWKGSVLIKAVTGGLLAMTSELRQGGFNRVEPMFLPEEWEVVRWGEWKGEEIWRMKVK